MAGNRDNSPGVLSLGTEQPGVRMYFGPAGRAAGSRQGALASSERPGSKGLEADDHRWPLIRLLAKAGLRADITIRKADRREKPSSKAA